MTPYTPNGSDPIAKIDAWLAAFSKALLGTAILLGLVWLVEVGAWLTVMP